MNRGPLCSGTPSGQASSVAIAFPHAAVASSVIGSWHSRSSWLRCSSVILLAMKASTSGPGIVSRFSNTAANPSTARITQGTLISVGNAFRGLLAGLIFCSVALLIGGSARVIWGICFAAAIYYFGAALTWLVPSKSWNYGNDHVGHWKHVAEMERELFGKNDEYTLDILAKMMKEAANQPVAADADTTKPR